MCNYKVLVHGTDGYVILCHSCRHYQLAFGITVVSFEQVEFWRFCKQVSALTQTTGCDGFENHKRIPLDIFCKCAIIVLNSHELVRLHDLLNEACFHAEMENLFTDLNLVRE